MKLHSRETNMVQKIGAVSASFLLAAGLSVPVALTSSAAMGTTVAYAEESAQEQAEAALAKLNSLQTQLGAAENDYNQAVMDKEAAQQKVSEAQTRIDQITEEMKQNQEKLGTRARSMYRSGSTSLLDLVLGSTTFSEFATNWGILETLNQKEANLINESKQLRSEMEEQKTTLQEQQTVAEQKETEAKKIYEEAQTLVSTQQSIYDNLSEEATAELEAAKAAETAAAEQAAASNTNNADSSSSNGGGGSYSGAQSVDDGTVLGRAQSEIGKPYVWGAVGPAGYDCSGFVSYCLTGSHSRLGTTYTFMAWPQPSNPQAGDIVVNNTHCGIYLGGGQIIHSGDKGVEITSIESINEFRGGNYIIVRY